jgi:RecB family exonuclease
MTDYQQLFTDAFLEEVEERKAKTSFDPEEWTAGGRASKAWPNKEDPTWWLTNGPAILEKWAAWWEARKAEGWSIWTAPGNVPAVELEVKAHIGSTMWRCYIDTVLVDPDGDLVIVDWKFGSMEPPAPVQLGTNALAMEKTLGVRPKYGAFFMGKKHFDITHLYDLDIYTEEVVAPWADRAARMEREGMFIPHPSNLCGSCGVRSHCLVMGGELAHTIPQF